MNEKPQRTRHVYQDVEVEISLDEFEVDDLIAEIEARGKSGDLPGQAKPIIERAYDAYRAGNLRALDIALRELFDAALGRLVGDSPLMEHA